MIISDSIKFEDLRGQKMLVFFASKAGLEPRVPSPVSNFDLPGFQVANSQGKNSK